MSREKLKNYETCKETVKSDQNTEKKKSGNRNCLCREAQMVDLGEKYFKAVIINMFKEQKETMLKELKEDRRTMFHQRDNINKDTEYSNFKRNQMEILESKSTVTEMKNHLMRLNYILEFAEELANLETGQ